MDKAVIFDADDLLVDSFSLGEEATVQFLKLYNCDYGLIPPEMKKLFLGKRIKDIISEMKTFFKLNENVEDLFNARAKIYLPMVTAKLQLMPGASDLLNLLKNKYKLALASSGTQRYISLMAEKFNFKDYFSVIVTGNDVTKGKPDPEVYLLTTRKLTLEPEKCLVLEDAQNGVEAAKLAGCKCIGVQNPNTPEQDLTKADLVVHSLREISPETVEKVFLQ